MKYICLAINITGSYFLLGNILTKNLRRYSRRRVEFWKVFLIIKNIFWLLRFFSENFEPRKSFPANKLLAFFFLI
jgi:hypothetical protein